MIGLIRKDLFIARSGMAFMTLFSVAFVLLFGNGSISCIIPAVVFSSLAASSIVWDEQSNWSQYAVSIGIGRDEIIRSKFILGLLFVTMGAVVGFLTSALVMVVGTTSVMVPGEPMVDPAILVPSTVLGFGTGAIVSAILLLANYLIGNSIKAQYVSIFINASCIAGAVALASFTFDVFGDMWWVALVMLVLATLITIASYRISSVRFGMRA